VKALGEAVVDLGAVAANTAVLRSYTSAAVMAVVKADAFGHGAVPVARAALAAGASWLGVASGPEALDLRAAGVTAPVLSWLHHPREDFAALVRARVDLSASAPEQLRSIAAGARRTGRPAYVHLKVDTGLARAGAVPAEWPALVAVARELELAGLVRVRGVWSHLTEAERPATVAPQVRAFSRAVAQARAAGLDPSLRHLANSAAVLGCTDAHFDLVRPGLALYGVEPVPGRRHGLRPAMTLSTRVVLAKRVPAGTGVSYGHDYRTRCDGTLALVPVGYADGVPRAASGRAEVLIRGVRRPVAGRIAMDQFVVDAGPLPVRTGDEVVVFGSGTRGEPTAADWAEWAGTIPHEILTGLGTRVPRRYVPALSRPGRLMEVGQCLSGSA